MESYCMHHRSLDFDDTLLDDENATDPATCSDCKKLQSLAGSRGADWVQNNGALLLEDPAFHRMSDHLDSPEDSPLLSNEMYAEFGNLSIGDFHCHTNVRYKEDNSSMRKLIAVSVLCLCFMIIELIGGYLAGSLAVMTDAAHLFSDFVGFLISIFSMWIGKRPPNYNMTFGYHRAEVLGAFLSVLVIWMLSVLFVVLAINRLLKASHYIDPDTMLLVSLFGLIINIIMGAVLHGPCHAHTHGLSSPQHSHNINVRAATAHILGDILQSVGVLLAAVIIKIFPNAKEVDPITTILFSVIIICATFRVARDSFRILLEASASNVEELITMLRKVHGVRHVHSVHLWTLSSEREAFSAHLAVDDNCDRDNALQQATYLVNRRLKLASCHIQIEAFDQQLIQSCTKCQELQC